MPVTVLAGEEDFLLYRRLEEMKADLVDPTWASFNYQRLDNPPGGEVVDLALSIPFGPGNKVIIIDRCDWFAKKRAGKSDAKSAKKEAKKESGKDSVDEDRLEEALKSTHPNTYLIFVSTSNYDNTLRLSKLVSKYAKVENFPKEKYYAGTPNNTLDNWVRKEAHKMGATIDDDALRYLLDGLEANLRHVHSELEKASIYILPEKHITLAHVTKLSPHHSGIFSVAEYWLAGNKAKTLNAVREMLSKQPAMAVIAALQTLLSKWVLIKTLCEGEKEKMPFHPGQQRRDIPAGELAKRLQGELKAHPYVLEMDIKRLAQVKLDFLVGKRLELTRLEAMVKTGQMPDMHALELFFFGATK